MRRHKHLPNGNLLPPRLGLVLGLDSAICSTVVWRTLLHPPRTGCPMIRTTVVSKSAKNVLSFSVLFTVGKTA